MAVFSTLRHDETGQFKYFQHTEKGPKMNVIKIVLKRKRFILLALVLFASMPNFKSSKYSNESKEESTSTEYQ